MLVISMPDIRMLNIEMLFIGMSFRKIHRHEWCSHQYLFIYPYDDVFYFCFSVFFLPHLLYNDSDQKLTFRDPCYKTVCRNMDCSSASKKVLRKHLLRVENELCQMQKIFLLPKIFSLQKLILS